MSNQRGAIVAKNVYGRLEHLKGSHYDGTFIGSCVCERRESTQRFRGSKDDVMKRWLNWPRITVETAEKKQAEKKEEKAMATASQQKAAAPKTQQLVVLVFVNGRTKKNIGAFTNQQKALDMASALETALEVSGAEGEYQLEEITIMG